MEIICLYKYCEYFIILIVVCDFIEEFLYFNTQCYIDNGCEIVYRYTLLIWLLMLEILLALYMYFFIFFEL